MGGCVYLTLCEGVCLYVFCECVYLTLFVSVCVCVLTSYVDISVCACGSICEEGAKYGVWERWAEIWCFVCVCE